MRYAVCLAGVPGRIVTEVLETLRLRYSDTFVFRGAGAPLRSNGLASYASADVSDVLRLTADAVFGKSKRPHGFCRNTSAPCAIKNSGKHDCGKSTDQTCSLLRPNYIIVIIQDGINKKLVEDGLNNCAHCCVIPRSCYDKRERTIESCILAIEAARPKLGVIRNSLQSSKSPLFLPPMNFKDKSLTRLFDKCHQNGCKRESIQFKKERYSTKHGGYLGRSSLVFPPAATNIRHGSPDLVGEEAVALSSYFRLGCEYTGDFQFDVRLESGNHMDGSLEFYCLNKGPKYPKTKHVNITVNDILL